jgi:hypothetical protein
MMVSTWSGIGAFGFKELLLWKWKSEAMNICAMKTRLSEAMELVSYQRGRNKGKQRLRK